MKKVLIWAFAALMMGSFALTSCSKDDDKNNEPTPSSGKARYTVIVYGHAGGAFDSIIENAWEKMKPMLTDTTDVRMVFLYKYGEEEEFSGRYANSGDIVWFELTSETNLDSLKYGHNIVKIPDFPLYEPLAVSTIIDTTMYYWPAENYILLIYGHGGAFDVANDYPDSPSSKGVLYDNLVDGRGMSMYELADGLSAVKNNHFKCIFFHNCLMGNIENLTQVQQYTDYFFCCSHVMHANSLALPAFLKALQENSDFERASHQFFNTVAPLFDNAVAQMILEEPEANRNLDMKMFRANEIANLNAQLQLLATRLIELYPTQKENIDHAADQIYRYEATMYPYLIDIEGYANALATTTGDAQFRTIADNIHAIFGRAIIDSYKHLLPGEPNRDFSLSVVFGDNTFYNYSVDGHVISASYAPSVFNGFTNWGTWLNTNTYWPEYTASNIGNTQVTWQNYLDILTREDEDED